MGNIVDTFEDRIQNAILIDSIFTSKIESTVGSIYASSGREATSVVASTERGEHREVTAPFEDVCERKKHYMCLMQMTRLEIIFQTR